MKIRGLITAVLFIMVSAAQTVNATTWNFGALAANDPPAPFTGEGPFPAAGITIGGVTLNASAAGNEFSVAYMDGPSGNKPAGLGVCSTDGGCEGSSDDNFGVTGASGGILETLTVWFGEALDVTYLQFRRGDHELAGGRRVQIWADGTDLGIKTIAADGSVDLGVGVFGSSFDFVAVDAALGTNHSLYLEVLTAVPEPGIVMLMGVGLLGLGMVRRKNKQA